MGPSSYLLFFVSLGVTQAIIFNGTTFQEEYACAVEGRVVGVCRESASCKAPWISGADCGIKGSRQVCCSPGAAPEASKSYKKCLEYAEIAKAADCSAFRPFSGDNRAVANEYPYAVALGYRKSASSNDTKWLCAGGLVSERFVLTTQVCAVGSPATGGPQLVRLGAVSLSGPALEVGVERVFSHPDYKPRVQYNDIALLRLDQDVPLSPAVRPACLHTEYVVPGARGVVAGWGRTEMQSTSDVLRKVDLPIWTAEQCANAYKDINIQSLKDGIDDKTMICAVDHAGGKDTCAGDSGAPLVLKLAQPQCTYSIVGVTSFGPSICGSGRRPSVYTRVAAFTPWIESIVWGA